jgi:hypothetical protein
MSRCERRPELDAPARLHPVDNVNADPIGEGQQVRIDGDVRKHAVWTSSWQEVGRCEAICQSAFKFGSDSLLMQFEGCLAL